jgi:glucosamine--fructose-6-phosphate aminotransferase (isomerizing)
VCGIFGYYNYRVPKTRQELLDCLLNGLRRLEYRGYDSAGVALDPDQPPPHTLPSSTITTGPLIIKASGKIDDLQSEATKTLENHNPNTIFPTHVGIGHTRWATHGPPTAINAHPHCSGPPSHDFCVVHNGIITNYKVLKSFLEANGEVFVSETDTEVIPRLCSYLYKQSNGTGDNGTGTENGTCGGDTMANDGVQLSLPTLIESVMKELEGAYALLIKSRFHPGELVACKRGSPLILGVVENTLQNNKDKGKSNSAAKVGNKANGICVNGGTTTTTTTTSVGREFYLASDASAVVEHTKRVIVLEDSDIVHLKDGTYQLFTYSPDDFIAKSNMPSISTDTGMGMGRNISSSSLSNTTAAPVTVSRALLTLEMEVSQILKGGYSHFMIKEIHEQPESLHQTMRGRIRLPQKTLKLGGFVDHLKVMSTGRRLMLVGCGTSYHACLAARPTLEELVGLPVYLELASDLLDRQTPIFRDDSCIFVSQSGETADTLAALQYAKREGALCVGITNTVGSAVARATHCGMHINAGAEIGVASTKAYTSQIVALTMMALALSEDSIKKASRRAEIIESLVTLPEAVKTALTTLDAQMAALAGDLKDQQSLLVFGRGYNYATALEAALKVKEVALMHSEGILAGEMKHGPLALVDEKLPILVIATKDSMHRKMLGVIQQLKARSAHEKLIILKCTDGDGDDGEGGNGESSSDGRVREIVVPRVVDALQPIVNIVPLQLLSYHLAVLRGLDVDRPRNLAKSVTVLEE